MQVVLKNRGIIMVKNKKHELMPTRTVMRWRMCPDYRRLNSATRNDHFPFSFMDHFPFLAVYTFYFLQFGGDVYKDLHG